MPVSPFSANLVVDFHASLSSNEVCGLLGGQWDEASRTLAVQRAFPVREAAGTGNEHVNVEMDPEEQVKVGMMCLVVGGIHALVILNCGDGTAEVVRKTQN